jgi:hypothetical protein
VAGKIQLHFDGDIAKNHRVSVRTLGTALQHLQGTIDRAHLDVKYGEVWKHARLRNEDYPDTEFILDYPREGGFIVDMIASAGGPIVKRIRETMVSAIEAAEHEAEDETERLRSQVETQRTRIVHQDLEVVNYADLGNKRKSKKISRAYGDRSIAKEVDKLLSTIRHRNAGDSTLELGLIVDSRIANFPFDRQSAIAFHHAVSKRALGDPVLYDGFITALDKGNKYARMRGKFRNATSGREVNITIGSEEAFDELHPHLKGDRRVTIVASPIIEYDAHDPMGGDIYFIGMPESLRHRNRR